MVLASPCTGVPVLTLLRRRLRENLSEISTKSEITALHLSITWPMRR